MCVFIYHSHVVLIHPAVGMVMVLFCFGLLLVIVQRLVHQQWRLDSKLNSQIRNVAGSTKRKQAN